MENVVWTNPINVIVTGNSLQKSCGCGDSGAQSSQIIGSGDGYLEFTATETTTMRAAGLGNGNTDNNYADIDFAILLWWNGIAEVRENGIYKWDTTYTANDRFRVTVEAGRVHYYKNGSLFYTSDTAPTYPLLVDTALHTSGSTVTDAVIAGAQ